MNWLENGQSVIRTNWNKLNQLAIMYTFINCLKEINVMLMAVALLNRVEFHWSSY